MSIYLGMSIYLLTTSSTIEYSFGGITLLCDHEQLNWSCFVTVNMYCKMSKHHPQDMIVYKSYNASIILLHILMFTKGCSDKAKLLVYNAQFESGTKCIYICKVSVLNGPVLGVTKFSIVTFAIGDSFCQENIQIQIENESHFTRDNICVKIHLVKYMCVLESCTI